MSDLRPPPSLALDHLHPAGAALADAEPKASPPMRLVAEPRRSVHFPATTAARPAAWRLLSFLALVVLPVALAAYYYFAVAADQYVAEFRFALRSAAPALPTPPGLFASAGGVTAASIDSPIVVQYIASRAIVDALGQSLDLRRIFARPEADRLSRLALPVSIEGLVQYWRHQVDAYFEPGDGTIVVKVRAFTAPDALALAVGISAAAEGLVNRLTARARHDILEQSEAAVGQAQARLQKTLAGLQDFRDHTAVIDPTQAATATAALAGRVRDSLLAAQAQRAALRRTMSPDAPPVAVLDARIASLDAQLRSLNGEITAAAPSQPTALSCQMGGYDELENDRKFAETAYQHALESLDRARLNADRQQIYVASFVPPRLPEEPLYPRRWRGVGLVALIAFSLWAIGGLIVQSVRDHLQ